MTEVHQFLSTFAGRDAIGMHTLRLRRLLRDAGFASDIYALDTHDDVRHDAVGKNVCFVADANQRRLREDDRRSLRRRENRLESIHIVVDDDNAVRRTTG